jgi:membrane protein DedA with SNARE-associated domain
MGDSGQGFLSTNNAPGHRGGAFEGVMLAVVIWIASFSYMLTMTAPIWMRILVLFVGMAIGIALGYLLTRSIKRRRQRRRTAFEEEYRLEAEREYQRKLAQAKAKGEI